MINEEKDKDFARISEMQDVLLRSRKEVLPSKCWIFVNKTNIDQLKNYGYSNFKRTLARNYFTWLIPLKRFWRDDQFQFLFSHIPLKSLIINFLRAFRAIFTKRIKNLSLYRSNSLTITNEKIYLLLFNSFIYNLLSYFIWEYVLRNDENHILSKLDEPLEGNPIRLFRKKKLISQDLANSVLEYKSIISHLKSGEIKSILELGSGYGRTAYVFLNLIPNLKYYFVDIPPALFVAEKYISNQFRNKRIFKFRKFESFQEIKEEFERSDIAFFLPNQIELLPPKIADLFINISSLHEMRLDQIYFYFDCIDRLIKKYVYIKEWKETKVPLDDIIITEKDYPIRENWEKIYWRECRVKTEFFEALFQV